MIGFILLFAGLLLIAALNKLPEKYSKPLGIALLIGLCIYVVLHTLSE